jgi:hypothetical protein
MRSITSARVWRRQFADTDFEAGCAVGAVAQEAFADPKLGSTVAAVVDDWATGLAAVLVKAGHDDTVASDLALLCISSIEGAITLSRVQRSARPIEVVQERLIPLLSPARTRATRRGDAGPSSPSSTP